MKPNGRSSRHRTKPRGFTLIEMLVVIAIIAILASLMLPSLGGAKRKGQRSHCANTMKHVGLAIQMYADDNKDYLPGPIDVGVPINYTRSSSQVLTYFIAKYLDLPVPSSIPAGGSQMAWPLVCAGYRVDANTTNFGSLQARCYSLNWSTNTTADAWFPFKPFGYISPSTNAHTLTEITYMSPPTERWMMQDVDQVIVEAKNWQWYPNLPTKPTHRPMWNRLYFDQHVAPVSNPDHAKTSLGYAP